MINVAKATSWLLSSTLVHVLALSNRQNDTFNPKVLGNIQEGVTASAVLSRTHAFIVTLTLGTPGQELRCLVDTGSADLWVPSKRCRNCDSAQLFNVDKSSSFSPILRDGRPVVVSVTYGSGKVAGYGAQETMTLGDWTIKNQSFIIVEAQDMPNGLGFDGIFGLGWKGIAHMAKPVYQRMQEAGHPAMYALIPQSRGEAKLVLGQIPVEVKTATLVWTPCVKMASMESHVKQRGFWIVAGGVAITRDQPREEKFLVDTGTNQLMLVPYQLYLSFIRSLIPPETFHKYCGMDTDAGNVVVCSCHIGQNKSLPPLRLYLGGRQFIIPVAELFRKVKAVDGSRNLCMLEVQPNSDGPESLDGLVGGLLPMLMPGMGAPVSNGGMPPVMGSGMGMPMGQQGSRMGMPIGRAPLPLGQSGGVPLGESVEEIIQRQPDGSTCVTTVTENLNTGQKMVQKKCTRRRRLQQQIPVVQVGLPMLPMMPIPARENPTDKLWILGGVFMEKFVTIFDFDKKQVGFAEFSASPHSKVRTQAVIKDFRVEDQNIPVFQRAYSAHDAVAQPSHQALSSGVVIVALFSMVLLVVGLELVRQRTVRAQSVDAEHDMETCMEPCE